jgi:hypothetical protein
MALEEQRTMLADREEPEHEVSEMASTVRQLGQNKFGWGVLGQIVEKGVGPLLYVMNQHKSLRSVLQV